MEPLLLCKVACRMLLKFQLKTLDRTFEPPENSAASRVECCRQLYIAFDKKNPRTTRGSTVCVARSGAPGATPYIAVQCKRLGAMHSQCRATQQQVRGQSVASVRMGTSVPQLESQKEGWWGGSPATCKEQGEMQLALTIRVAPCKLLCPHS